MSFIQWCCERGAKSRLAKEIPGIGRRRNRDEKGNQGVGDFRFINILRLFSIYFFFSITFITLSFFLYTFFTHDIYPHTHPRPTTSTHQPRPTTFSYTYVCVPKNSWRLNLTFVCSKKFARQLTTRVNTFHTNWSQMGGICIKRAMSFRSKIHFSE